METVKLKKQPNGQYSVVELAPIGGRWVIVNRDMKLDKAEESLPRHQTFRDRKIAHLREVREELVNRYGADPQKFDPIVE
jgi:hypothetical protein